MIIVTQQMVKPTNEKKKSFENIKQRVKMGDRQLMLDTSQSSNTLANW